MVNRIIQRSPDLGLRIKLQRNEAQAKEAMADGPWWAQWYGADGQRLKVLEVEHFIPPNKIEGWKPRYRDGLWVAVVEGVAAVSWRVTFTPVISVFLNGTDNPLWNGKEIWRGAAINFTLSGSAPPMNSLDPYPADQVVLPEMIKVGNNEIWRDTFWPQWILGRNIGPGVSLPVIVSAGNTLSVAAGGHSLTGELRAVASVGGTELGAVSIVLRGWRVDADVPPA